jgi:hypothetical protein
LQLLHLRVFGMLRVEAAQFKFRAVALHAEMQVTATADTGSKAAHADLNTTIATSQGQARALAQHIKKNTGYTTVIGDQLQLEGAEDSVNVTQKKPAVTTNAKLGGLVEVGFDKLGGLVEGVHIFSQRDGDAGFGYLASETHSPNLDNRPLLTAGKPVTRQYKAVFFLGKSELGLPSGVGPATAKP